MNSYAHSALLGPLFLLVAACSGGTNPVDLAGSDHGEDPGPQSIDYRVGLGSSLSPTTGTISALCLQACAHLHAADCSTMPAARVDDCASECGTSSIGTGGSSQGPAGCDDELAAYFECVAKAEVTCSATGAPKADCADQNAAWKTCSTGQGGGEAFDGCVAAPSLDTYCSPYGSSYQYYLCDSAASPGASCIGIGNKTFCCIPPGSGT